MLLVIGVPLASLLSANTAMRFALIGSLVFIMIVELLNTAIEKLSDRLTLDTDPTIKRVKDMGSAAILLSLCLAGALWIWAMVVWLRP